MYKKIYAHNLERVDECNIIDIRDSNAFQKSHIPSAINIPFYQLMSQYSELLKKENEYYIYCQSGTKSKFLCNLLNNKGYNVINIVDGFYGFILTKMK